MAISIPIMMNPLAIIDSFRWKRTDLFIEKPKPIIYDTALNYYPENGDRTYEILGILDTRLAGSSNDPIS